MVIPAGFEPGITGLRILRPVQLDEGTMAVPTGLEPAISCVTGRRDNQLHYGTMWHRTKDLNLDLLSQSQACCHYTNPVCGAHGEI